MGWTLLPCFDAARTTEVESCSPPTRRSCTATALSEPGTEDRESGNLIRFALTIYVQSYARLPCLDPLDFLRYSISPLGSTTKEIDALVLSAQPQ